MIPSLRRELRPYRGTLAPDRFQALESTASALYADAVHWTTPYVRRVLQRRYRVTLRMPKRDLARNVVIAALRMLASGARILPGRP